MTTTAPQPQIRTQTQPTPQAKTKTWLVATVAATCVAMVGIVAAAVLGTGGPAHASAAPVAVHAGTTQYHSKTVDRGTIPANAPDHRQTPTSPSASVKLLQQQLGQLNYYNGPITGYEDTDTVNAIKYLQHDAGLPQTGQLDQATRDALSSMLVHGNNQMAN
ncbi:peptidoglycan-binding domain-containing protein [Kribbella sp. NPDC050820]|uniref:peptidoglycan-binding domain-containing protein n=1 Tax=Kribbella sp. NPDC050820 TaxID=3155408 RepID=UPI0033D88DE8